ncbi:hypothetical protein K443DRAFT_686901 [Laccaria amethystina LaAM-08-1]|uniref:Uncharacterized protein n=1 Tax=Laccaria amethystina LaAM-08-1 TaxID=1095629 RepID=A0A0C9X0V3_9AGAR|nr:hypothetical protein K443DRAFT_686901 [Laccaria amethystina LaAM-08-1]
MLEGDTLRLCKLTSCVSSVISYVPTPMANHRIKDGVVLFVPDFFGYPDDFAKNGFENGKFKRSYNYSALRRC